MLSLLGADQQEWPLGMHLQKVVQFCRQGLGWVCALNSLCCPQGGVDRGAAQRMHAVAVNALPTQMPVGWLGGRKDPAGAVGDRIARRGCEHGFICRFACLQLRYRNPLAASRQRHGSGTRPRALHQHDLGTQAPEQAHRISRSQPLWVFQDQLGVSTEFKKIAKHTQRLALRPSEHDEQALAACGQGLEQGRQLHDV